MSTLSKSESARANGAKSKGPTTPEGKLASSQNSVRHGILSRTIVLEGESKDRFEQIVASLKDQVQPRNCTESAYVQKMAISLWRQIRVWGLQKTAIELEMARFDSPDPINAAAIAAPPSVPAEVSPMVRATLAMRALAGNTSIMDLLHRYETAYDRQFLRAQAAIQKMRRQELIESKEAMRAAAAGSPNPFASIPRLAHALVAGTFIELGEEEAQEDAFLRNEPTPG